MKNVTPITLGVILFIALVAIVCGLFIVAKADASMVDRCATQSNRPDVPFACTRTVVARQNWKTAELMPVQDRPYTLLTRWVLGGEYFLSGYPGCRTYGRKGNVIVQEITCGGGFRIKYRSRSGPTPVTIEWETI